MIASKLAGASQYDQALEIAKIIKDDSYKQSTLAVIARELAGASQYDQALEIAKTIKNDFYKAESLGAIARELATAGEYNKALEIVQKIQDFRIQARSLTEIGIKQAAAGKSQQADQIFAQALKAAETLAGFDTATLEELAHQLADAGQYAQAQKFAEIIRDDSTNTRQRVLRMIARYKKSP